MARKATGAVIERPGNDGRTYRSLRFTAYGKRRFISLGAVTAEEAERELRHVMADVERGTWQPDVGPDFPAEPEAPVEVPTFHQVAELWFAEGSPEWAAKTRESYGYELEKHLLPAFGHMPVDQIKVADVDAYRVMKLTEGKVGGDYINKTLMRLGAVLDLADEREYIDRNPVRVRSKHRRVKPERARRDRKPIGYLDRAEHIVALVEAGDVLNAQARVDTRCFNRRALLAVLVYGGLRISEALALRWRDVDLANGRLRIPGTKSGAADREPRMLPVLRDELLAHRAKATDLEPDALVFPNGKGRMHQPNNTLKRTLRPAVKIATEQVVGQGLVPLPFITQHSLRHTYVSMRVAIGDDRAVIQRDAGHKDGTTTDRVYTHVMDDLDDLARERLRHLVDGRHLALGGTRDQFAPAEGGLSRVA